VPELAAVLVRLPHVDQQRRIRRRDPRVALARRELTHLAQLRQRREPHRVVFDRRLIRLQRFLDQRRAPRAVEPPLRYTSGAQVATYRNFELAGSSFRETTVVIRTSSPCIPSRNAMILSAAAALVLAARPVDAHDFWIVPASFHPEVGTEVGLSLRVGEHFRGEPVLLDRKKIERFFAVGPSGESSITPRPGADPAGFVRIEAPGVWIAAYRSRPSSISLAAEPFERYLAEEGLERIIDLRAKRGESGKRSQEIYSRCAKSILSAGTGVKGGDRPLGLTLELVADENPSVLQPGQELSVRLLYEGNPLSAALVVAMNRDEPDKRLAARSDSDGRATFRLARAGPWLIKAVHMVPAPPETRADWESLWASLTFEVPARSKAK